MKKNPAKFVIIDGNALIHRSFHALPPTLTTKEGVLVNAVYGFTAFILKAFLELEPEFVVLTLDRSAPTFRHEEYADYKATRIKAPDELYAQIPLVKEVARALDISVFEQDGLEADDLIGALAERSEKETDWENIIITGDMDTLQLVTDRTFVYTMGKGFSESKTYGIEEVKARYGLSPNQIIDYKGLRGDPSDNIPGVKGIGEKGASELLKNFKNLEGVYQALENDDESIKARTKELLKQDKDNAFLSRRLATIDKSAQLKYEWEDFRLSSFDENKATELFQQLEFKSLINKLKQVKNLVIDDGSKDKDDESQLDKFARNQEKKKYKIIDSDDKFKKFLTELKKQKSFALTIKTDSLDPISAQLVGLSCSWRANEAYYLHLTARDTAEPDLFNYKKTSSHLHDWLSQLQTILEDKEIEKYGHNLKFAWRVLKNQGINLQNLSFDTLIASYLLHPENRQHNLDSISFRELNWQKINEEELMGKGKDLIKLSQVPVDKITQFAGEEADCIWQLKSILEKQLQQAELQQLFQDLEMPLIKVLGKMEEVGIKLEAKPLVSLSDKLAKKLTEITKRVHLLAAEDFNLNSPKQLQSILFEKLKLDSKGLKKTKTGISTADDELEKIIDQHKIVALIQEHRELSKIQNTYALALPKLINEKDGRIHTHFNQSITATGRLSSADPNLQNIPTRSEEGQEIRKAFAAKKGYQLLGLDYSQIELRLAAHLSKDQKMIEAFINKEDIHSATAAAINNVDLKEVSKEMRRAAKAINFGILYGQGPHGLSREAGISYSDAKKFIDRYFEVYPGIKQMMDKNIAEASNKGYAETLFKRRRPLPELHSNFPQIKRAAERMAMNMPIQGSAADMIKKAMIDIDKLIQDQGDDINLLLQIHDELIFEVKADKLEEYEKIIKKLMTEVISLSVPIVVETCSGNNWGDLK
jgi:DNA polymerase I